LLVARRGPQHRLLLLVGIELSVVARVEVLAIELGRWAGMTVRRDEQIAVVHRCRPPGRGIRTNFRLSIENVTRNSSTQGTLGPFMGDTVRVWLAASQRSALTGDRSAGPLASAGR